MPQSTAKQHLDIPVYEDHNQNTPPYSQLVEGTVPPQLEQQDVIARQYGEGEIW
jgi:hypothetical protein